MTLVAIVAVMSPSIDASLAGFALAFSGSFLMDVSAPPLTGWLGLTLGSF